jgi:hypothetical protein
MATSYILNLSVTKTTKTSPEPIPVLRGNYNPNPPSQPEITSEVTKIIQKAGSLAEVKRIVQGLIELLPEDTP